MRRRPRDPVPPGRTAGHQLRHNPFRDLAATTRRTRRPVVPAAPPAPPAPVELSDAEVFAREMADVVPLPPEDRARVVPAPPPPAVRVRTDPDAEAMAELSELVTGQGPFDLSNTCEFVEGAIAGLDRRLVRRLRAGDFAFQSHLDLHGLTAAEARVAIDRFLTRAHRNGERCVLIVHGRGLNSKDQIPVLKNRVTTWLAHGTWARLVLAFTSARPCDGGAGALYVLLRRQRAKKQPLAVTRGGGDW